MRWFYVSLLCLFAVLFNHTVLPFAVPARWADTLTFWQIVFASDFVFFVGALAGIVAAVFVSPYNGKTPPE